MNQSDSKTRRRVESFVRNERFTLSFVALRLDRSSPCDQQCVTSDRRQGNDQRQGASAEERQQSKVGVIRESFEPAAHDKVGAGPGDEIRPQHGTSELPSEEQ